ncbi:MAG: 23S rRNA (adenine(2503)-C(2))-methyltransferase RlmN [Desulfuromonadia bacterium]
MTAGDTTIDLKNFTRAEMEAFLSGKGKERFRATQIFKWIYQKDVRKIEEMTNLSRELRKELSEGCVISDLVPETVETGRDGTRKYLFTLADGESVESVLIPDDGRNTLCISSQVGCAMGCDFCLTGTFGLTRNLTASEIVNQVCAVRRDLPVNNIVFMGMGEPLHNLDNVVRAITILQDDNGLQFSSRKITVSTSGLVPQMTELGRRVTVNLAVSLNATTNEQRDRLMPVNRSYPIEVLIRGCRDYPLPGRRKITIEYVMIRGVNDTIDDAKRLLRLISDIPTKVNLIPFNEHEGASFHAPTQDAVDAFHRYLIDRHVTVITRQSRGGDISAACGQLKGRLKPR